MSKKEGQSCEGISEDKVAKGKDPRSHAQHTAKEPAWPG